MDWGTNIVDAGGSFHDIAKDAFDGIHKRLKEGPLNSTLPLLQDDFKKTYNNLMSRTREALGMSAEESLSVENMQSQLTKKIKGTIARLSIEAVADALLQAATGLEGPVGLIIAEAINFGVEAFKKYLEEGYSFQHGEWVFIDLGERPRRQGDKNILQIKADSNFFSHEAFFAVPDDIEYSMVPHHALGFIMGSGERGDWVVFNFETGKEEERGLKELRPCPAELKTKLDASEDFSVVREVKFLKDHDPTLKSYLPTESGQVVLFHKEPHTIIEREGDKYMLESKAGTRIEVSSFELEGGRTENTASWDHSLIHLGSFTSKSTDALFVGEWVWVPANDFRIDMRTNMGRRLLKVPPITNTIDPKDRLLALVDFVKGRMVHYTRAYDGVQSTSTVNQVYGAKDDIVRVLNSNKAAQQFKSSVLHNNDVQDLPLGEALPLLTLGKGPPGTTDPQDMQSHMKFDQAKATEPAFSVYKPGMTEDISDEVRARREDEFYGDDRLYDRFKIVPAVDKSNSGSGFAILVGGLALVAIVMMA